MFMPHLLFIHPDQKLISIYQKQLSRHFSVDSAHDGLIGLRKIRNNRPRMIISEYLMPYMSGLSLLKFVRNHPEMYATPFLFLTNEHMPNEALGLGASAWIRQNDHRPEQLISQIYQLYH
jgi:two-component system response regulator VicR